MKSIDIIKENKNIIEKMTGFKVYFTKENSKNFPIRIIGDLICCPMEEYVLSDDKNEWVSNGNRSIIYFENQ
jgi:hypothetical protein